MVIDLAGTALLVTAICGGVAAIAAPLATVYLQLKASKSAETNKAEAITARANLESKVDSVAAATASHTPDIVAIREALVTLPPTPDKQ
jgi:hypothetical protein